MRSESKQLGFGPRSDSASISSLFSSSLIMANDKLPVTVSTLTLSTRPRATPAHVLPSPAQQKLAPVDSRQALAGHVGHLTRDQQAALSTFKDRLEDKGYFTPPRGTAKASHDDVTLTCALFLLLFNLLVLLGPPDSESGFSCSS